jgi:hypothetical protein
MAQFYMHQPNYAGKVTTAFKVRCEAENTPKMHRLALCNDVAKELFNREPAEVQEEVRKALDASHDELLSEYNEAAKGLPSVDPGDQAV